MLVSRSVLGVFFAGSCHVRFTTSAGLTITDLQITVPLAQCVETTLRIRGSQCSGVGRYWILTPILNSHQEVTISFIHMISRKKTFFGCFEVTGSESGDQRLACFGCLSPACCMSVDDASIVLRDCEGPTP